MDGLDFDASKHIVPGPAPLGFPRKGCAHHWVLVREDHELGQFLVRRCAGCNGVVEMLAVKLNLGALD